ncbi:MAG: LPS export ABC transporter permease LptG [Hyphomicrobiaceae bacterium]|nr:LPS export ABC transporter permease LptG [Hyphomicrobiaceae bacterium]
MKTLSRYILRKFTISIISVFVLCMCLIFLIDLIEMMRITLKKNGTVFDAMYISLLRVPSFAELSMPFAVLIGSIGSFLVLSKNSELIIARSSGMSVWQFIRPALYVGGLIGILASTAYNPLAAISKVYSETYQRELSNQKKKLLVTRKAAWLREDGPDGQSVLIAEHVAGQGAILSEVTFFQYDQKHIFKERIDARKAILKDGRWVLEGARVSAANEKTMLFKRYIVSTYLTKTQIQDSIGAAENISFWDLPKFIKIAEKAGLPAKQYRLQYQTLLSRPLWMIAMVMLAATCSLQSFRFGNVQKLIFFGLMAGFVFFVFAQMSRNMGLSGHTSTILAAWGPAAIACLLATSVLIHQEDG